nr:MAG TPA: hypothetical protein [Caudoviricetes sp.]
MGLLAKFSLINLISKILVLFLHKQIKFSNYEV